MHLGMRHRRFAGAGPHPGSFVKGGIRAWVVPSERGLLGAKMDILSASPATASVLDATLDPMLSQRMSDFELIIASGGRLFRRAALEDFDVAVD